MAFNQWIKHQLPSDNFEDLAFFPIFFVQHKLDTYRITLSLNLSLANSQSFIFIEKEQTIFFESLQIIARKPKKMTQTSYLIYIVSRQSNTNWNGKGDMSS